MGAQSNRGGEIGIVGTSHPELVEETDVAIFQLITNEEYAFPTVLPEVGICSKVTVSLNSISSRASSNSSRASSSSSSGSQVPRQYLRMFR